MMKLAYTGPYLVLLLVSVSLLSLSSSTAAASSVTASSPILQYPTQIYHGYDPYSVVLHPSEAYLYLIDSHTFISQVSANDSTMIQSRDFFSLSPSVYYDLASVPLVIDTKGLLYATTGSYILQLDDQLNLLHNISS